ncbi:MAG: hypothetical protein J5863_00830 [Desulfovibrio sp.]|nr:hypothetical protein [Desulfovibrio sp.]
MKRQIIVALALLLCAPQAAAHAAAQAQADSSAVPASCEAYAGTPRHATCLAAVKHGLSLNAAAVVEGLAERAHAVEFCRAKPDAAEARHTESILAGGASFRALFNEHRARLEAIDVEDPDAWCAKRGFERR